MVKTFSIIAYQIIETLKGSGLRNTFRKMVFIDAETVPVVKDLENARSVNDLLKGANIELVELTKETLPRFKYAYRFKSRLLKVKRNISKGYKAFAVVSGKFVIGDIWYVTWETTQHPHLHEDVDLLFLNPGKNDVYMFDMFVDPQQRGKNIATALMGSALYNLKQCGYHNAFGFFEMKNIPALWTHRVLKFKELEHVFFSRYFLKQLSRKKAG